MASPSVRSHVNKHSTANPHLTGKPAGLQAGDLMVLFVMPWQGTIPAPADWTSESYISLGNGRLYAYTKRANADDAAATDVASLTNSSGLHIDTTVVAVKDAGDVEYVADSSGTGAWANIDVPGFVAKVPNVLLLQGNVSGDGTITSLLEMGNIPGNWSVLVASSAYTTYHVRSFSPVRGGTGYIRMRIQSASNALVNVIAIGPPSDDVDTTLRYGAASGGGYVEATAGSWANLLSQTSLTVTTVAPSAAVRSGTDSRPAAYLALLEYDLRDVPGKISDITFRMYHGGWPGAAVGDDRIELRAFNYGDSITSADWLSPAELLGCPLVGYWDVDGSEVAGFYDFTSNTAAFLSAAAAAKSADRPLRLVLCGKRYSASMDGPWRYTALATGYGSDASGNFSHLVVERSSGPEWTDLSLVINDDAVMTHDNDVVLSISAEDHYGNPPDEMRIGEGPPTATEPDSWTDWMPFQTEKPWRLAPQTDQDVHRRGVGVEFRNTG